MTACLCADISGKGYPVGRRCTIRNSITSVVFFNKRARTGENVLKEFSRHKPGKLFNRQKRL